MPEIGRRHSSPPLAIGCGISGLFTRDQPRVAAGIGTGIGVAGLAGFVNGLMFSVLIPLFSR